MNPRFTLVQAFPPEHGYRGAATQISDIRGVPAWFSKIQAVHTCVERNLEAGPAGKGKKAFRRVLSMFPARRAFTANDKLAEFCELRSQLE